MGGCQAFLISEHLWRDVLTVQRAIIGIVLVLTALNLSAQNHTVKPFISVTLTVDGETVPCYDLKIKLSVDHQLIPVKQIDNGFIIPDVFAELYATPQSRERNNVDVRIDCGEYTFEVPDQYPAQLLPGEWKLAIRFPQAWFEGRREDPSIETGTWISVIDWECNICEPVRESTITHTDPPA